MQRKCTNAWVTLLAVFFGVNCISAMEVTEDDYLTEEVECELKDQQKVMISDIKEPLFHA